MTDYLACDDVGDLRGSVWDFCTSCGARVTIAPSGQDLLASRTNMKVVCLSCVPSEVELQPPTFTQLAEIAEHFAGQRARRQ